MPLIPTHPPEGATGVSPLELYAKQLHDWGLSAQQADDLGIRLVPNAEARLALGRRTTKYWDDTRPAARIPVYGLHGEEVGFRMRFLGDPPKPPPVPPAGHDQESFAAEWKKAHAKYLGPKGAASQVHHPKGIAGLSLTRLAITEGEIKAESGTRAGTPTLGLPGWHNGLIDGNILKEPIAHYVLHPAVHEIVIVFDSDANRYETPKDRKKSKQAMQAIIRLCAAMRRTALNGNKSIVLKYAFVPDLRADGKTGLDDYLATGRPYSDILDGAEILEDKVVAPEYFAAARDFGPYIVDLGQFYSVASDKFLDPVHVEVALGPKQPAFVVDQHTAKQRRFSFREDYLKNEHRYSFRAINWAPCEDETLEDGTVFNSFIPDYPEPADDPQARELIEAHLELFFAANAEHKRLFWAWLAHLHQFPMKIHDVLLHFYGTGGSGKTLWGQIMQASLSITGRNVKMWGTAGSRFDDSLAKSLLTFADELNYEQSNLTKFHAYLRDVTTAAYIDVEVKYAANKIRYMNASGKLICQNPGDTSIAGPDNRRVWTPDIPQDTANRDGWHPCTRAARALAVYFNENREKVAGTVRTMAFEVENVLELYQELKEGVNKTEVRAELARDASPVTSRAHEFLDHLPEDIELIENTLLKSCPPYSNMSESQIHADLVKVGQIFPRYNGGIPVMYQGETSRLRIVRNHGKWLNKRQHTTVEVHAQIDAARAWFETLKKY